MARQCPSGLPGGDGSESRMVPSFAANHPGAKSVNLIGQTLYFWNAVLAKK